MKKNKAFTLSEILIAITIIGIIAVLTIPNLFSDTSAAAFNTKFKTTFNQIQSTLSHAENVQKHPFVKVAVYDGDTAPAGASYSLDEFMKHHFNISSQSGRTLAPASQNSNNTWSASYRLKNGAELIFSGNAIDTMNATGCTNNKPCIAYIDVNGQKEPNQEVKCTSGSDDTCIVDDSVINDIFPIEIRFSNVYPHGYAATYVLNK